MGAIRELSPRFDIEQGKPFLARPRLVLPYYQEEGERITEYATGFQYSNSQRMIVDWNHRQVPPPVYIDRVSNGRFLVKYDQKKPFNSITTTQEAIVRIDVSEKTGLIFGGGSSIAVDRDGVWSVTGKLLLAKGNEGEEIFTMVESPKFKVENGEVQIQAPIISAVKTELGLPGSESTQVVARTHRDAVRVETGSDTALAALVSSLYDGANGSGEKKTGISAQGPVRADGASADVRATVAAINGREPVTVFEPAVPVSGNGTDRVTTRRIVSPFAQEVVGWPAVKTE